MKKKRHISPELTAKRRLWWEIWNFDSWAKIAEVIGFILLGFSFLGSERIGYMYEYLILCGIIIIFLCLFMMFMTKFNESNYL